jgi:NAD(P)-dependent dehydrogenase (short-subunit alcohol dehydrogenase family)
VHVFKGKTAVVTGGGSGIGRALALELAGAGANVVVTDRIRERVDEVVAQVRSRGVKAGGFLVDHSKREEVRAFAEAFFSEWEAVDVLCCNAGVGHGGRIEEIPLEDWEWVLDINLWGPIYMVHHFVPGMIQRRQGWILITSSGLGIMPTPGMTPYVTSKYAMVGFAESLRAELSAYNIKVSALCPGVINTNIVTDGRINLQNEKGENSKAKVATFYATKGTDPAVVARDGVKALARDVGIIPTPLHTWPGYVLHRLSPALYGGIARYVWKKRLLV